MDTPENNEVMRRYMKMWSYDYGLYKLDVFWLQGERQGPCRSPVQNGIEINGEE